MREIDIAIEGTSGAALPHRRPHDHHSRYRVLRARWSRQSCRRQVNSLPLEVNHV